MSIPIVFFLFFTFLGFLLAIFFFLKKSGDKFSNRLLAIYTLLFSLEMLQGCLKWSGLLTSPYFTHFTVTNALLWMSYGPLVYFYVRRSVTKEGLKWRDILLFSPTIVMLFLHAPFYFTATAKKIDIISNYQIYDYVIFPSYAIWIVIAIMAFYAVFTFLKFKDKKEIGYKESIWIKWFVGTYAGFVFFFALYVFLVTFNIMDAKYDYIVDAIITIFIVSLAYFGFVQPEVFNGFRPIKELIPFVKYKKTGLSKALSLDLKESLLRIMEKEKPYLNNELRLDSLADLLNISRNQTSQIINEQFNLSFFDFINRYRVEDATQLLIEPQEENLNITNIAYSVGFNNRASFYKAFRKFTNKTPSDFLNHQMVS